MQGRTAIVIVAAGSGTRMGGTVPKQFRDLAGRPLLSHTIDACLASQRVERVVCVVGADQGDLYAAAAPDDARLLPPATGGTTRQASVLAGLRALADEAPDVVLIHDAARPFVSAALVERVIDAVAPGIGALSALPVADTLTRGVDGLAVADVARDGVWQAQTPQGFAYADILAAHEAGTPGHTDDASLARAHGLSVRLVEGDRRNGKITTAEDFALAEATLTDATLTDATLADATLAAPDIRVGHGYDTHRLTAGNHVMLCGVRIQHDQALDGHSDADVGLHALTDALLATIGAGDIGDHFPPSEPQWKGTASHIFLAHAVGMVRERGGRVTLLDVTLVCEAPKIGPHRTAMRERVAEIAGIEASRVSVKATTNEERGFVGRGEGIVALATATVAFA